MPNEIQKVLDFWQENQTVFSSDLEDFKRSKSFASGDGFSGVDNRLWAKNRARIYADFVSPAVNGIISLMESSAPEITNYRLDKGLAGEILKETLEDGKSFLLVRNEGAELELKRLSNLRTYVDEDGAKALHVSKISKKEVEAKGGKFSQTSPAISEAFTSTLAIGRDETYLLTFYELVSDHVEISEFTGNELLGRPARLPLTRLPIVCFKGERVFMLNRVNYRGLYYKSRDILLTMSFLLSYLQEKITNAPNIQFLVAEETLGDNLQMWTDGEPKMLMPYKSADSMNGDRLLPPPQRADQSLYATEPLAILTKFQEIQANLIGAAMAGERKGTETAEAVLMRRESKEAAGNYFVRQLITGFEETAKIMSEYFGAASGNTARYEVVDKYFEKMRQDRDRELILSIMQIAEKSPAFAAVIAEKTDLDADTVKKTQAAIGVQNLLGNAQRIEQEAKQAIAEAQRLAAENEKLQGAILRLEAGKQEQVEAARIRAVTSLQQTIIQNQTEVIKLQIQENKNDMDFSLKFAELQKNAAEAINSSIINQENNHGR